jgi:hypothetical protein
MNLEELRAFLIDANKHTYSTGDESLNNKEKDGSTTILYQNNGWKFHDNFFGGEPYGGREVVFYENSPVWMMVYYGYIEVGVPAETIYPILQKALRQMPREAPFRGPKEMKEGNFQYHNQWNGTIEKFSGKETISLNDRTVYEASYIGGVVDRKK